MPEFNIPEVIPIHDGSFVTIPSEAWKDLCKTINNIAEAVNTLRSEVLTDKENIKICSENISKIAGIVEGIYEIVE